MINQKVNILLAWLPIMFLITSCGAQFSKNTSQIIVGGGCEGCEAIFEFGDKNLSSIDTLPEFEETEPKLKVTGIIYQKDGKTPAIDVILYIYHTDRTGNYKTKGTEQGWAKRHGYVRGWIKTDSTGSYTFFTFKPAAYPDASEPAHIHATIKEPGYLEYYLDDYVFDDDPLLTPEVKERFQNRGGSGITTSELANDILTIKRDIILGRNIPDYEQF